MTHNKESNGSNHQINTHIATIADGKKRRRKNNRSRKKKNGNKTVIPQKTKIPNNQRTRYKLNRHEKRN